MEAVFFIIVPKKETYKNRTVNQKYKRVAHIYQDFFNFNFSLLKIDFSVKRNAQSRSRKYRIFSANVDYACITLSCEMQSTRQVLDWVLTR